MDIEINCSKIKYLRLERVINEFIVLKLPRINTHHLGNMQNTEATS